MLIALLFAYKITQLVCVHINIIRGCVFYCTITRSSFSIWSYQLMFCHFLYDFIEIFTALLLNHI